MRLYWELARCGFRRTAIYRSAALSGAITNTFFGFLRAYTFIALYQTRGEVGGYRGGASKRARISSALALLRGRKTVASA